MQGFKSIVGAKIFLLLIVVCSFASAVTEDTTIFGYDYVTYDTLYNNQFEDNSSMDDFVFENQYDYEYLFVANDSSSIPGATFLQNAYWNGSNGLIYSNRIYGSSGYYSAIYFNDTYTTSESETLNITFYFALDTVSNADNPRAMVHFHYDNITNTGYRLYMEGNRVGTTRSRFLLSRIQNGSGTTLADTGSVTYSLRDEWSKVNIVALPNGTITVRINNTNGQSRTISGTDNTIPKKGMFTFSGSFQFVASAEGYLDNLYSTGGMYEAVYSVCVPNWTCFGYGDCINNSQECNSVADLNFCGDLYTGNYSEFAPQYCFGYQHDYSADDISPVIVDFLFALMKAFVAMAGLIALFFLFKKAKVWVIEK